MRRLVNLLPPLIRRPLNTNSLQRSSTTRPRLLFKPTLIRQISSFPRRPIEPSTNFPNATSEYSDSILYTFRYLSRTIKYLVYSLLAVGGISAAAYEGAHLYIEKVCLTSSREDSDEFGWVGENQSWTGGSRGGTDPRLGIKARHALRAAWICQEWGAGSAGTIEDSAYVSYFHPDYVAARSMISTSAPEQDGRASRVKVDRGYELADEYVNLAIQEAKKKGLVFPPMLSGTRPAGPPNEKDLSKAPQGDPAAVDLLLIKAGILERINTIDCLLYAKDVYEQVLCSLCASSDPEVGPGGIAKVMRLAGKVGDLCARTGGRDEAMKWWQWGLRRAGVDITSHDTDKVVNQVKRDAHRWFGKNPSPDTLSIQQQLSSTKHNLAPPILRATVSLLISASTQLATTASLSAASTLESLALFYLPSIHESTSLSPAATLHSMWMAHRTSLLQYHLSSVLYALNKSNPESLPLVTSAQEKVEGVIAKLRLLSKEYAKHGSPLNFPAKNLARDVLLTGAEVAYTRGLFLEHSISTIASSFFARKETPEQKKENINKLETAVKCFEEAMSLSGLESGVGEIKPKEDIVNSEDWEKYNRAFVRAKRDLAKAMALNQEEKL
ncbi:hypothetical protein L204_104904 [Cryptococcus depauperatus]|nr:hypothetical protein L204_05414 [Cryptococcus depauperatus CBS 7855]